MHYIYRLVLKIDFIFSIYDKLSFFLVYNLLLLDFQLMLLLLKVIQLNICIIQIIVIA